MTTSTHPYIDIPFTLRHTCWFCGEPSNSTIAFPKTVKPISQMEHFPLTVPSCKECATFKYPKDLRSILALRAHIKQALIDKYAKHLGIGENWTEQEIIDSEFSGSVLGGFGKSAWEMYEIARQRVNYKGWSLSIDNIPIEVYDEAAGFEFNGTRHVSVHACIDYFTKAAGVDKELLTQLIGIVSPTRFDYALRIAKLNKDVSHTVRSEIIEEVLQQESDQEDIQIEKQRSESLFNSAIEEVNISGTIAPAFAIQWAISNHVKDLAHLCSLEDEYFDEFEHLGGPAAFMSYNGLQLYVNARENTEWVERKDPNKKYWI